MEMINRHLHCNVCSFFIYSFLTETLEKGGGRGAPRVPSDAVCCRAQTDLQSNLLNPFNLSWWMSPDVLRRAEFCLFLEVFTLSSSGGVRGKDGV